jgi:ribonuclease HI
MGFCILPVCNLVYRFFQDKNKELDLGSIAMEQRRKFTFSLGQYTTIFQAEVYAIKACAVENLDRDYKNRNICILSHSQAAITALGKYQITSKLVWGSHQSHIQLARHNRVQLLWTPGREGIADNETADLLARI